MLTPTGSWLGSRPLACDGGRRCSLYQHFRLFVVLRRFPLKGYRRTALKVSTHQAAAISRRARRLQREGWPQARLDLRAAACQTTTRDASSVLFRETPRQGGPASLSCSLRRARHTPRSTRVCRVVRRRSSLACSIHRSGDKRVNSSSPSLGSMMRAAVSRLCAGHSARQLTSIARRASSRPDRDPVLVWLPRCSCFKATACLTTEQNTACSKGWRGRDSSARETM